MTTEFRPQTIAVLRAIHVHGPVTSRELDDMELPAVKSTLVNLQTHRYIESNRPHEKVKQTYTLTPKGIRTLASLDVGKGDVAKSRERVSEANYTGEAKAPARPGSQDAYSLPSLHQGERVERRRPVLMGAKP